MMGYIPALSTYLFIFYIEVNMDSNGSKPGDSVLRELTGFMPKAFVIIIAVAYMSVLTLPPVIQALGLPALPVVLGIMLIQYCLLFYVGKIHGDGVLKTMRSNGFIGWLMWLALICMLMLPVVHLLTLVGVINSGA
ncbi:hypothetical protein [Psychromonas sp. B3M02]|uniref:hypothetical protein n=1 Tax=Psychromonas sp. B3M02 TaxID=2267226 RepID=UPI0011BE2AD7|nr:hypothetical protein [Psychromonas sp. B3M02]